MSFQYYTVGPSPIYSTCAESAQTFFKKGFSSESHRSSFFVNLYQSLDENLRNLMNIPSSHAIFILSSGSEIMERISENIIQECSFHFINGAFSKKMYQYANNLGIHTIKNEINLGAGFNTIPDIPESAELLCLTHNETSTGVKTNELFIHNLKKQNPNKIISVDCVSSAPFAFFDFNHVDMAFFSVQKAFGLPAGLGIWIINKALAEQKSIISTKYKKGTHNTLNDLLKNYSNFQTPSTPNILDVYLLNDVCQHMNNKGIDTLYQKILSRKKTLQHEIQKSNALSLFVKDEIHQSDTVVVCDALSNLDSIKQNLLNNNIKVSAGYGELKSKQIRIANFPAVTDASFENLIHTIRKL